MEFLLSLYIIWSPSQLKVLKDESYINFISVRVSPDVFLVLVLHVQLQVRNLLKQFFKWNFDTASLILSGFTCRYSGDLHV